MSGDHLREELPCLRTHVAIQSGVGTRAPVYIAADADYESGDGNCGLHEDEKYANEPAIIYVRADLFMDMRAERNALRAELKRLREMQEQRDDDRLRHDPGVMY